MVYLCAEVVLSVFFEDVLCDSARDHGSHGDLSL